ncbi:MAG: hypothetical protein ABJG88_09390 [Litorimonas sp.]
MNELNDTVLDADDDNHLEDQNDTFAGDVKTPRRKYGKFALGVTALSALIIGGASGGGFVQYIMPYFGQSQGATAKQQSLDLTPLKAQMQQLTDDNAAAKTRLSKMTQELTAVKKSTKTALKTSLNTEGFSNIEARLKALESSPEPTIIDEDLLERLESLQKDGSPALDLSAFEARLTALEEQQPPADILEAFAQQQTQEQVDTDQKIAELSNEVKALRKKINLAKKETKPSQALAAVVFPKQALLDEITAQAQDKPLLKRALGKHIKVKTPSDPATIIAAIEADIAAGNIPSARTRFDKLSPELRLLATAWRDSVN